MHPPPLRWIKHSLRHQLKTYLRVREELADDVPQLPVGPHPGDGDGRDADGEEDVGHREVEQEAVGDRAHLAVAEDGRRDAHVGDDGGGEDGQQHDRFRRRDAVARAELAVEGEEVARAPAVLRVVAQQVGAGETVGSVRVREQHDCGRRVISATRSRRREYRLFERYVALINYRLAGSRNSGFH